MRSSRPPPVPPAPRPDGDIGPYRLANRIAVGGMAEVFRALDQPPAGAPRAVVIKRMLPLLAAQPECRLMFEEEARLGLRIQHDNVVQVMATGQEGSIPYIVLEYVFGVDLWRLTRHLTREGRRLPIEVAMYVVTEMLAGLAAVHAVEGADGRPAGIVHRDVSPSNVFLSVHGDVKLGDLGIAGAALRETHPTAPRNTRAKGKLGYLAPEQVSGQPSDQRADVFAAAVIAAELIMGRPLFTGGGEIGILLAIRDADIKPFRELAPSLPPGLGLALLAGLERSPEVRTDTAGELRERLLPYVGEEVVGLRSQLGGLVAAVVAEAEEEPTDRRALAKTVEQRSDPHETETPSMDFAGRLRMASELGGILDLGDPSEIPQSAYRVRTSGGDRRGPFSYAQLVEAIATGRVGPKDLVSVDGGPESPIGSRPSLARHLPPSSRTPTVERRTRMVETNELHDLSRNSGIVRVLLRGLIDRDTGLLLCEHREVRREVYLQEGAPVYVASNLARDLLGEYLLSRGVIDRAELDMALAVMPRFEGRLGETLSALGLVEPVHLVRHIAAQVRERLLDVFSWDDGRAAFYAGVDRPEGEVPLDLDPWEILDTGLRMRFELGLEADRFAGRGAGARLIGTPAADDLLAVAPPWDMEKIIVALRTPRPLGALEALFEEEPDAPVPRARRLLTALLSVGAASWVG